MSTRSDAAHHPRINEAVELVKAGGWTFSDSLLMPLEHLAQSHYALVYFDFSTTCVRSSRCDLTLL